MANSKGFVLHFNYCKCKGCDVTLEKVRAIDGVHSIHIDEKERELTVFGPANPEAVIRLIKGSGKIATKFLRAVDEESPPGTNHEEMPIWSQQNLVRIDPRKVAPMLPGLIDGPVDKPTGKIIDDCPKPGHELQLLKEYKKPFKCNGCREGGFASAYRCMHCSYELHEECKDPKPEVTPDFFKGSKFKYRQEPEPEKVCYACGMEIHGHSYSCEERNLDLHPACSKLPLRIRDTDFELSNMVEHKCLCCNSTEPKGLCYGSKKNNFACHVQCASQVMEKAWKRGDFDGNDGDDNHGILKPLKNLDGKPVANVKGSRGKGGGFLKVVSILLKTIISIFFGDPTGLIVSIFTELGKELLLAL